MSAALKAAIATQKRSIRWALFCAVVAGISAVGLLAVSGWFLAGSAVAGLGGTVAVQGFNYLLPSAAIRAAAITRTATRYGERWLSHRAALYALAQFRTALFGMVAARALAGKSPASSGSVANRLGSDVDALEDAVIRQVTRPGAWSAGLASAAAALMAGWIGCAILLATLALMRWCARGLAASLLPEPIDRAAAAHEALQADYAEMVGPCADIAVYGLAPAMADTLAEKARQYDLAQRDVVRAQALVSASQTLLATVGLMLLASFAQASAPIFALAMLGTMAGLENWGGLAVSDMRQHRVDLAQRHLASITAPRAAAAFAPPPDRPDLMLCGQSIAYGSRLLVRGPSGVGKTRLLETLIGLREDAPQPIVVDGAVDRADGGLAARRAIFALAAQDAPIMAGSVADNLALARSGLTETDMWEALKLACVDDVVRALPDGLQQWLGGDGARLSGGQKRRIALARALLTDRPWLVLDEPSEGLDAATEERLVVSLEQWLNRSGKGLLLVSHRPAMARLATSVIDL
jgi:ATP-binding cassette subfamily C protein CydC